MWSLTAIVLFVFVMFTLSMIFYSSFLEDDVNATYGDALHYIFVEKWVVMLALFLVCGAAAKSSHHVESIAQVTQAFTEKCAKVGGNSVKRDGETGELVCNVVTITRTQLKVGE